jgi:uncharacterized OsmC-like protein
MYRVDVTNSGTSVFLVRSADYEFAIDTKGKGMTPPDTLLASLGSCVGVYIRKYAEGAKLPIGAFRVTVTGELSKEAPVSFREIGVSIELTGADIDERRRRALGEFLKNCPIHNTLKNAPTVNLSISQVKSIS